jgi:hypothetical protein
MTATAQNEIRRNAFSARFLALWTPAATADRVERAAEPRIVGEPLLQLLGRFGAMNLAAFKRKQPQ